MQVHDLAKNEWILFTERKWLQSWDLLFKAQWILGEHNFWLQDSVCRRKQMRMSSFWD
jgi:hypothetical protein